MGEWDRTVDVVVVGKGIAGACAALEAHRAGAEVLVLERAGGGGGASALSEGIFYLGGGTPVQQACGYEDTAQNLYDFLRASTSHPDDAVVRAFAEGARDHFDWLEQQGVPFTRTAFPGKVVSVRTADCLLNTGNEKVWPFKDAAEPVPRGHQARSDEVNGGLSAMRALLATCEAEGIETICNAPVTGLETDADGRVVGVTVTIDGTQQRIGACCGVVIATGSFTNNAELVQKWLPLLSETSSPLGVPSNDGAGLELAQQAGAALAAMEGVIATASIYPPENLIKGIVVNSAGERFVAEDSYHGRLAGFIMEQPGQKAYLIVDSEIFAYPETEGARHVLIDGYETVAEMERGLRLPQGVLVGTLDEYNRDVAQGVDTRFHKQPPWLKPLDQAPYAAFDISFDRSIYLYITLGGIDTDSRARALDPSGKPIAGSMPQAPAPRISPGAARNMRAG
jgi:succinate dehydrogenase/fumarate reductase flavoprotein subunit